MNKTHALLSLLFLLAVGCGGGIGSPCKSDSGCAHILICYGGACNDQPGQSSGAGAGGSDAGALAPQGRKH